MGSGKSTVGAVLAGRTGRRLVDVDDEILDRTGRTVRELWLDDGEAAYRALESEIVLGALSSGEHLVVAVPGGAVLDPAVRTALESATVVWLRTTPTLLGERVQVDDHRPLLGDDPAADLTRMARDRNDTYSAAADLVVDTDELDPRAVADEILARLERLGARSDRQR